MAELLGVGLVEALVDPAAEDVGLVGQQMAGAVDGLTLQEVAAFGSAGEDQRLDD